MEGDWKAWNQRSLTDEPIVRLILDGTVVRVRLDKKATTICLLVVLGVRDDGQKVLLAVKKLGGETAQAWRVVLDDLIKRGLRKPEFLIVDGGAGLEKALAEIWNGVHKHRNLLAQTRRFLLKERPLACRQAPIHATLRKTGMRPRTRGDEMGAGCFGLRWRP